MKKSNLHEEWDHIYIQMLIKLHRTEAKAQAITINCLNNLDSIRFTEQKHIVNPPVTC